ncbi:MAG: hypothetical protein IJ561_05355, partial [Ruminococcus sp.]|nr:hypothetical protein [Ruminococcus sp.]
AKMLDSNLAENLVFNVEEVSLMYCTKSTSKYNKSTGEELGEFREFRPYWVFELNTSCGIFSSCSLKVDAISGEIIVDASVVQMNSLRDKQKQS